MALALSELAGRTRPDIFVNPRAARPDVEADERSAGIFTDDRFREAIQEISSWPGYVETPLLALNGLAREFGVGQVWYKDEGDRFGLGSFKALGGAYAVYRILADRVRQHRGDNLLDGAALADGRYRHITGQVTVTTATDGNHGRSVAWGAHKFGCDCVIYIHRDVSSGRERAITRHGAEVVRVDGNYDDAVRRAAADAERERRVVVSDTSYEGNTEIPCFVMDGYAVMVAEALRQVPPGELPTHVFVQAGVGALAAAVCAYLRQELGERRPTLVVVEPIEAACLLASARAGRRVSVHGGLDTLMAGLAAGEVSTVAWQLLRRGVDAFVAVDDAAAVSAMRRLAEGSVDPPVVAGESAVAGICGLAAMLQDPNVSRQLLFGPHSKVLVFGTEGDSDPETYTKLVGRSSQEVRASPIPGASP